MTLIKAGLCVTGMGLLIAACSGYPSISELEHSDAASVLGERQEAVIGGANAADRWRFMVEIQRGGGHACGGVLVHPKWVLTARHCYTTDGSVGGTLAAVGSRTLFPGRFLIFDSTVGVAGINLVDNPALEDMVLVELPTKVSGLPIVSRMTEGRMGTTYAPEKSMMIGWGATDQAGAVYLNQLQEGYAAFLGTGTECAPTLPGTGICTGNTQDAPTQCSGDSGGPVLLRRDGRWFHNGVVSYGGCQGLNNSVGVQIRTASFASWIESVLPASEGLGQLYSVPTPGTAIGSLQQTYSPLSSHWEKIVQGDFDGDGNKDLFFYRGSTGSGQIYSLASNGALTSRFSTTTIANGWSSVVAGDFSGDAGEELLFYNAATGAALVYNVTSAWALTLATSQTWTTGLEQIVPGNFNNTGRDDVFVYRPRTGMGAVYQNNDGNGTMGLLKLRMSYGSNWDIIVPGKFESGDALTDLFFYDGTSGTGTFSKADGTGDIVQLSSATGYSLDWTEIVPIENGSGRTGLFLYNQATGQGLWASVTAGGALGSQATQNGFAKSWSDIIPIKLGAGQSLLFYSQFGSF